MTPLPSQENFKARSEPVIHFQNALLALAKMDPLELETSLHRISELDAETMGVERVSIWFFEEERSEIVCHDLFQSAHGSHEKGMRLRAVDYPAYFRALEENRILAANDAAHDPSTREFTDGYLKPNGITSMMDVPIWRRGKMVGIVCHEHTGPLRKWTLEERDFAVSIADLVSLSVESLERKKAEEALKQKAEELKRSNRELEQFAYIASHDLQEPVRKVIAFVDRLKAREEGLNEEQKTYLNRIQAAAFQMKELIEDLLDYSRISTRAKPFDLINLNVILQEAIHHLDLRISETGARIRLTELPRVKADRVQMMELFQNLLSNALKFRKPDLKPDIRIEGTLRGDEVEIRVIDNGIGFEMKHLEKIFQPFQRLHGRGEYEGSGIGLAVCQKIVERHHGELTAESEPGKGSVFIVRLPSGKGES